MNAASRFDRILGTPWGLVVALVCWNFATAAGRCEAADAEAARRQLKEHGLVDVGFFWICPAEAELRRRLEPLDSLVKQCRQRESDVQESVEANARRSAAIDALLAARVQKNRDLADPNLPGPARRAAQREIRALDERLAPLQSEFHDADHFGAVPKVRRQVVAWINARQTLALHVAAAQDALGRLDASYEKLRGRDDIGRLLAALGRDYRLGPAKDYRDASKVLTAAANLAASEPVPVFRENGQFRVGGVVNERVPTLFSIRYGNGPSIIPDSLAQAAAIAIKPNAPRAEYRLGKRSIFMRQAVIPKLRIGRQVLEKVNVYVLPPEGEDLGATLGPMAFVGHRTELDGGRLQMRIEPVGRGERD